MFWIGALMGAMAGSTVGFFVACAMQSAKAADQETVDVFEQMQRDARKARS